MDEPPSDEELYGVLPDPDTGPPDGDDAWLASWTAYAAPGEHLPDDRSAAARPRVFAAGFLPRERTGSGIGSGFGPGEVLDTLDRRAHCTPYADEDKLLAKAKSIIPIG